MKSFKTPWRIAGLAAATLALACATASRPPGSVSAPALARAPEARPTAPPPPPPPQPLPEVRPAPLRPVPAAPAPAQVTARASLAAVGDVLMHGAVKDAAADHRAAGDDGFAWLWAPIADLLAGADLTFANLETPIAPRAGKGTRAYVFNAPPVVPVALRHAGVKLVSVANNHAFDQGRPGFEETLAQLDALGLPYVGGGPEGAEAGPRVLEVNGLKIAFLGYAQFFNQDGNACPPARKAAACLRAAVLDPDRAVEDVRRAAASADAVVVSVHWGEEYQQQPREKEVALAHRLADAGALVILGHHPHVLQPLELYPTADGRVAFIAYSLGNFVSNQSRTYVHGVTPEKVGAPRDAALVRVELARRDYGRGVTRVELAGAGYYPLWTENDTADPARRARKQAHPAIQVVSLDRALAQVRAALAALPDPVPAERRADYVALRRREELYLARRAAIAAVLGDDLQLEAPAPPLAAAAPAP